MHLLIVVNNFLFLLYALIRYYSQRTVILYSPGIKIDTIDSLALEWSVIVCDVIALQNKGKMQSIKSVQSLDHFTVIIISYHPYPGGTIKVWPSHNLRKKTIMFSAAAAKSRFSLPRQGFSWNCVWSVSRHPRVPLVYGDMNPLLHLQKLQMCKIEAPSAIEKRVMRDLKWDATSVSRPCVWGVGHCLRCQGAGLRNPRLEAVACDDRPSNWEMGMRLWGMLQWDNLVEETTDLIGWFVILWDGPAGCVEMGRFLRD